MVIFVVNTGFKMLKIIYYYLQHTSGHFLLSLGIVLSVGVLLPICFYRGALGYYKFM